MTLYLPARHKETKPLRKTARATEKEADKKEEKEKRC